MGTPIYICLLGVFSFHTQINHQEFRGRSTKAKEIMGILGGVGYVWFLISLIWSFWHFAWWQPIVTLIASIAISGISAPMFQRNLLRILISPITLVVFSSLSIAGLILN